MASDVARHIFQLACNQQQVDISAKKAASKRLVRFEAHVLVELPTNPDDNPIQISLEARAPTMVLHQACADNDHWYLEYEGTQYDITVFPEGVSFVLRCVVDTLLSRLSDEFVAKDAFNIEAHTEIEVCAFTRFGSSLHKPSGVLPWTHTFGRLFVYDTTDEESYEEAVKRYIISTGKHIVSAGKAVKMLVPRGPIARH